MNSSILKPIPNKRIQLANQINLIYLNSWNQFWYSIGSEQAVIVLTFPEFQDFKRDSTHTHVWWQSDDMYITWQCFY
jgi:hypothetical protein